MRPVYAIGLFTAAILVLSAFLLLNRSTSSDLTASEQTQLLAMARRQLVETVTGREMIAIDETVLSKRLLRPASCFVSLIGAGDELRGCMIDRFAAHEPLARNVVRNVMLAAGDDRFPSVDIEELDSLRIELSILTKPHRVAFRDPEDLLSQLSPGIDGVLLRVDDTVATYLPSVWESFPDPAQFLSQLCEKEGLPADRWRTTPYPTVETYKVFVFSESPEPAVSP